MSDSTRCEWCEYPNALDTSSPETLCDLHAAEYEGLSEDQLYRQYLDDDWFAAHCEGYW